MRYVKTVTTSIFLMSAFTTQSMALTQANKGAMNYAGMCTALADEGNKILREKGKTTNFNSIINAANSSIKYIQNQPGAMDAYRGFYNATLTGMKDYTPEAKVIMISGMLVECAKEYGIE